MKTSPQKRRLDDVSAWKRSRCSAFAQLNVIVLDSPLPGSLAADLLRWDAAEKAGGLWKKPFFSVHCGETHRRFGVPARASSVFFRELVRFFE